MPAASCLPMFCQVGSFLIYFVLYLQARHRWLGRAKVGFCGQLWNLLFSSRIISGLTKSPVTMSCQLHLVKKKICGMSCRKSTPNCGHSTYLFVWPLLRHLIIAASSVPHCLLGCFFLYFMFVLKFVLCVFLFIFSDCSMCLCEKQHSALCIGIALQCTKFVLARQARRVDATNPSLFDFRSEETLFGCFALETFFALLALATGQT